MEGELACFAGLGLLDGSGREPYLGALPWCPAYYLCYLFNPAINHVTQRSHYPSEADELGVVRMWPGDLVPRALSSLEDEDVALLATFHPTHTSTLDT